jgi:predicted amidophosphoribosyltransferase
MNSIRDKSSNIFVLGIILIILGGIFTLYPLAYVGDTNLGTFLIVIGVLLLIAGAISRAKAGGGVKYATGTRRLIKDHCPNCGALVYSKFSRRCSICGYEFEFTQTPIISEKKVEEPVKTSNAQRFPPISELIEEKEISTPLVSASDSKTEEIKTTPSTSEREEVKSIITCPYCHQKLPSGAKFCARCGRKFEVTPPTPPISDLIEKKEPPKPIPIVSESKIEEIKTPQSIAHIEEVNGKIDLNWLRHQYYDLGRSIQDIADELGHSMIRIRKLLYRTGITSEKKEVESITEVSQPKIEQIKPVSSLLEEEKKTFKTCPHCGFKIALGAKFCATCGQKIEVLKPIPPISDIEEELPSEILIEEARQIQSVPIRKDKKPKRKIHSCNFCGMRIPKNNTFCLQCGMIIKST